MQVPRLGAALFAVICLFSGAPCAFSQSETIEEIVVTAKTGSRILRQGDSPSPLSTYETEDMLGAGLKDFRDLVCVLSINAGAENNSDNLTQNFTVGTANINLRGLGVASTLVLLNGRRQVLSSAHTDDGSSFVDLAALVPMLAVERVEILKDGAAAIYGSEAVAGVVNLITRQGFKGAEVEVEYLSRTGGATQEDRRLDALVGGRLGEKGDYLLAASYLDRSSLVLIEVDWLRPATSGFGNPGSFRVPSLDRTLADPRCAQYDGLLQELATGDTLCRFDYGPQVTAIPNEERLQVWGRFDWRAGDTGDLFVELGYANNDIRRDVSPSFPVLNTPMVPAYHPGNPYGEDVWFQGRPYGYGQPPEINFYEHETTRAALGWEQEVSSDTRLEVSLVHGVNQAMLGPRDVIAENFQAALLGFGGHGCADSANQVPGQGECLFFNPFSSAFSAQPGDVLYNAPQLRRFIIGDYLGEGESRLNAIEANLRGRLPILGGAYAAGVQYRNQSLEFAYDPITRSDGFAFLIGNSDFAAEDQVFAAYAEAWLALLRDLELTLALRYEDYGGGTGDTLDPKATLLYRASESLSLRGSFSTSFRAPSPFQTQGVQTNFTNIIDYDGSRTFAGRRTLGDSSLKPETSRAYNFGVTWDPSARWSMSADLWRYTFEDVLRKENAQAIVNANPFDTRIQRTPAGTISIVNVAFINADSIETSGLDFSVQGELAWRSSTIALWGEATWLLEYEVTNAGQGVDALGKLNRANLGAPNQQLKAVLGGTISRKSLDITATLRHTGDYEDDAGGDIDSFTTLDLSAKWSFAGLFGSSAESWLRLGVANLFDRDPPYVAIAGSYDPRSADPRGRRLFLSIGASL